MTSPTCPGLLWSHRIGDKDHPGCCDQRGLYPGSDTLRQVCSLALARCSAAALKKAHSLPINTAESYTYLKLNLKHSTQIPDISFPPRKISLQTPVRHLSGRQPSCWDLGARRQQLSVYTGYSNSSSSQKTGFYETPMYARCWGGG